MIDKGKAIDKLQALKGDAKGLEASVFNACIQGIKEMPEEETVDCCVKTADEMFRELGYEKTKESESGILYSRVTEEGEAKIHVGLASKRFTKEESEKIRYGTRFTTGSWEFAEIQVLARLLDEIGKRAQLIREMEAQG